MKDMANQQQKGLYVIRLIITFISTINIYGQNNTDDFLSIEDYDLINSVITDDIDHKVVIYEKTFFDKDLIIFFDENDLNLITKKVGIPVTISDDELRNILTDEVRNQIISKIVLSKPLKLDAKKLNEIVVLSKRYDTSIKLANNVYRITKPIIIDDIAIFRRVKKNESSVHILKREDNKWVIKYTFNSWQILQ